MKKMKIVKNAWIYVAGLAILASCTDILDTYPEGGTFTEDQKREVVGMIPGRLSADINGLYSIFPRTNSLGSDRADDFGYPMVAHSIDCNGADIHGPDDGYNWFTVAMDYSDRTYTYANPRIRWSLFYDQIKAANDILASIPEDTDNPELKSYKGQALAVRAFDYFNLVQTHQFTYKGNEDKPSIPIVTFGMTDPANPRASVDSVYHLIMTDLNEAIILLDTLPRGNKMAVDRQVAYGIRARVNLVMQNWDEAASDAAKAREGFTLLSRDDVSKPTFVSVNESSWIWGLVINAVNIPDVLASWPSKLSSFTGYGYTTAVSVYKQISNILYDKIPDTDVRKGWWINENQESALLEGLTWGNLSGQDIAKGTIPDIKTPFPPYTNVKFGIEGAIGNDVNESDWVMMRAEEMLLIEAEAKAMSGDVAGAKTMLEDWVKNYRDPEYVCDATTAQQLRDEIWFQRRVELWGEGHAFLDLMRLEKNLVRFKNGVDSNFPDAFKFNMAANDGWRLMRIPQTEINSNTGISETENNSEGTLPQSEDGAGLMDGVTD